MSYVDIPECYQSIVGLTRSDCACYTDVPDSAADSLSGLYIDELVGLSFVQSMTNCDNGNELFLNIEKARDSAITAFQADTNALLLQNFKVKRTPFYGGIGRNVDNNNIKITDGSYLGARIYCNNIKSGVLYIKDIGTLFKTTGTVDLSIYNNIGDLVTQVTLTTEEGKHYQNPVSLELPLHNDYIDNLEYFFVYQYASATMTPKINDIKCNCGSFKPVYNCSKPYFNSKHESNYGWADWIMVGGINSASLPDFTNYSTSNAPNSLFGLTFNIELRCKIGDVLCKQQLDFEGNPLAPAVALAIQHKAGEILGNWVLQSGNLSRFTMINTEQFIEDVKNFKATYNEMIKYIVDSVDITQNDCLACRDVYEMAKRGIFA